MRFVLVGLAAAAALPCAAGAAPLYAVTRIAPHDTRHWIDIEAVALNQVGGVVGVDYTHRHSFRWSAAGGLEWLEDLPGGADNAQAADINDAGVVVGVGSAPGTDYPGEIVPRAVAWMPGDAAAHDLQAGLNPKAHRQWLGHAYAINDAGQVAGIAGVLQGTFPFLLDLASGESQALGEAFYPYRLNESGATAGAGPYDPRTGGSLWQYRAPDGHRTDIPGAAGTLALNARGQVGGQTADGRPYVWSEAEGTVALPVLAGMEACEVDGLNDAGVAIGTCNLRSETPHAILWTPDGLGGYAARDVRDLVAPDPRRPEGCLVKPGGGTPHCFGEVGVAVDNAGRLLVNELKTRHFTRVDSEPLLLTPPAGR